MLPQMLAENSLFPQHEAGMIPRILEIEVMDTAEEAREYDDIDHREVNARFADDFERFATNHSMPDDSRILDIGTGTALIPIEIAQRMPGVHITAIDLAEEMLILARRNVERAGLAHRIRLQQIDAKDLAASDRAFDAVVSNSIIHHIPEPLLVFREIRRVVRPGGVMFVRDLLRPETEAELQSLVDLHAAGANARQRQLLADSLHAALTLDEVRDLSTAIGLSREAVQQTSDRHWTVACKV
jgi:ubiquinone/menaquinone biosynthesis C-methylase UbiE